MPIRRRNGQPIISPWSSLHAKPPPQIVTAGAIQLKRLERSHVHHRRTGYHSALRRWAKRAPSTLPAALRTSASFRVCGPRRRRPVPGGRGGGQDRTHQAGERRRAGDRRPICRGGRRRDPMTLGTPLPASMRAIEPSRVIKLTVEVFHTLAAMAPEVLATVGAAVLDRMEMLQERHRAATRALVVRHRPAAGPGSPRLRQLPASQRDSRTSVWTRTMRCCSTRRWCGCAVSDGGAARRHAPGCPDDAFGLPSLPD